MKQLTFQLRVSEGEKEAETLFTDHEMCVFGSLLWVEMQNR